MPNKLFGVDIRLPAPNIDRPRTTHNSPRNSPRTSPKNSPSSSVTELRRASMDHIKRPSLPKLGKKHKSGESSRGPSKDRNAKDMQSPMQQKMIKLGMYMESPPIMLLGAPNQCLGAMISGRLQLTPNTTEAIVEDLTMYLECTTTLKKPVSDRCRQCGTVIDDVFEWKFLTKPKVVAAQDGMQELPFSHMIPGTLPATTHGQLGSIDYSLHVKAKTSDGQDVEFWRGIVIRRALYPGNDKHSVRIFPPTNLQLHVTLPSLVHPIGEFPVQCRMTGITEKKDQVQTRWRLRKLTWRIQELTSMVSPACPKHQHKVGGDGKGIQHEATRDIAVQEMKEGWKTDISEGEIEGEFMAAIDGNATPNGDMESQNGMQISHNLIMELVIAEEIATNKDPEKGQPTGAARILRTQFNLTVCDRLGMGISWDDEQPPMYEEVPRSPPHYQDEHTTIEDYEGEELHEDVEQLNLNS